MGLVVDCIATVAFVQFCERSIDSSVDARPSNVSTEIFPPPLLKKAHRIESVAFRCS